MKIKTNELTGAALNWAVTVAEGDRVFRPRVGRPDDWDRAAYEADGSDDRYVVRVQNPTEARFVDWTYNPSESWWQAGPIIERERLSVVIQVGGDNPAWHTSCPRYLYHGYGPTPLIAAMRCYVASKLGDEVEIPEELTESKS